MKNCKKLVGILQIVVEWSKGNFDLPVQHSRYFRYKRNRKLETLTCTLYQFKFRRVDGSGVGGEEALTLK